MKHLYKIPLPEVSTSNERDRLASELAEAGVLGDTAVVDQLSSASPDLRLEGQFRLGEWHASLFANELEELSNSSMAALPLFSPDGSYSQAGYYEVGQADIEPAHANARDVYQWTLDLSKRGTRAEFFRAVEVNPRQVEHDEAWGNDLAALVGVPESASKVQWFDAESGARASATPVETRAGEFDAVEVFDLDDGSAAVDADAPVLIYSIEYAAEAASDCTVYDTRGEAKYLENDDGRVRLWESVFQSGHDTDPDAELVLDNGLVRVRLDEAAGTITAEAWDAGTDSWSAVSLTQPSGTSLFDVDLTSIAMAQDRAQLTFDVDGSLFALDASLQRGADAVLFEVPENEADTIPQKLVDWLDPVAASTLLDSQPEKTLVARRDVRR